MSLYFLVSFIWGLFAIDTSPEYRHEDRELTKFERQTVALLKKKFDYPLLDTELKTLRELSDSDRICQLPLKKVPRTGTLYDVSGLLLQNPTFQRTLL